MTFRVTAFSSAQQALRFAQRFNTNISEFQQQISSGLRIDRPSDDPIAFRQISSLRLRLQELRTESASVSDTETKLNTSVSQLRSANDLIVRARTLAQQGVQSTSQSERTALAVEVDSLLESLQNIAATRSAGSYLYGGTRSDQPPYEFGNPRAEGGTLNSVYLGSSSNSQAYIGESLSIDTFAAGDQIFGLNARQETLIFGNTGAKVGAGTDNLVGRAQLRVRHSSTTYLGASGIAPGVSSPGGDTVISPGGDNNLVIRDTSGTGDSGTITFNNGPTVLFTRNDTNLKVTDNSGREIYVDTSAISPGFDGTVDFIANGTLSVDGGVTEQAIDFSESQAVVDSFSGRHTFIDSQDIDQVGDDHLEFPGTSDVFQALFELGQDLRNTRDLSNTELAATLDRRLGELGQQSDHILEVVGSQAASLQTLNDLDFRIADLQLEVETQLSEVQSTDIPETALRLQNDQNLLEFTYAVAAQISSISLIDFLR